MSTTINNLRIIVLAALIIGGVAVAIDALDKGSTISSAVTTAASYTETQDAGTIHVYVTKTRAGSGRAILDLSDIEHQIVESANEGRGLLDVMLTDPVTAVEFDCRRRTITLVQGSKRIAVPFQKFVDGVYERMAEEGKGVSTAISIKDYAGVTYTHRKHN